MAEEMLDPMGFAEQAAKPLAPRLANLEGKTIGLLDIGFPNGNLFLDRVEELLKERYGVAEVIRRAKPSPARPAKKEVREDIVSRCDAVIEALSS
jgi:hypothetical protein